MLQVLQDSVNNPDVSEPFTILRYTGNFVSGGYQQAMPQSIEAYGTVGMAGNEDLEMTPEADRVHEVRVFHMTLPFYLTGETRTVPGSSTPVSGTADVIVWRNTQYRCVARRPYPQRGYYAAIAARMAGQ